MAKEPFSNIQRVEVLRYFRGTIILALVAVLLVVVGLLVTIRVERVSGTEVGVKLNNLTGDMSVLTRQGTHIYNGLLSTFHVLDRTVQRLEMTATPDRGDRRGADDVRVKTIDGSDVFLDLTINYRMLIDPESVKKVLLTSGSGNAYKAKWVRDYSRSICRTVFGELTTEQFYDSAELNMKKLQAKDEINENLKPFGLEVMEVVAEKFRFHEEYEAKIQEKKLADQEVEEQLSKANAARQNQIRLRVEAEKRLEVAVASYTG
ncbi:hypothetical protein HQ520_14795, partial [bacterium]|nr:hypothetical protein [bacterium]